MAVELSNIKADVEILTIEIVSLEGWNGDLAQRNMALMSDLKSTIDECDHLKRRLKDMEEENARLRVETK
ncbi:hypothetical protein Dimus_030120, partial [Dionaea muscipula]